MQTRTAGFYLTGLLALSTLFGGCASMGGRNEFTPTSPANTKGDLCVVENIQKEAVADWVEIMPRSNRAGYVEFPFYGEKLEAVKKRCTKQFGSLNTTQNVMMVSPRIHNGGGSMDLVFMYPL